MQKSKVQQMRDTLLQAIEQVRAGTMPPERAKAMATLAHQVTASLDVELRVLLAAKTLPAAALLAGDGEPAAKTIATGLVERGNGTTRHTMGD